jgi:Protein of unknown function (DUF2510)
MAETLHRPPGERDLVARSAGLGLLIGAVVGTYLGFLADGGATLGTPVLIALGCMLAGVVGAVAVGQVLSGSRRHHHAEPKAERVARPVRASATVEAPPPQPVVEADHLVPEGWYPDPRGSGQQRYWDGERWTEHLWSPRAA